ncbi:molybdopterin molybdenumtransferase MoeA [Rathayibacter sp. AY1F3]|nr:molybdopterin molybdenumtransferase MoeA [Rathayibacter sp. AY1F3]
MDGMSAHGHEATDWDEARRIVGEAVARSGVSTVPLLDARGAVLDRAVTAARPLPHYDSSAMDGWAVRGPGPWPLEDGTAAPIVTGAAVPDWSDAVLPSEQGAVRDDLLTARAPLPPGRHVRRAGDEAARGAVLVDARTRLTPAHLALLAVAGVDALDVRPPAAVDLLLTGDEVDTEGMPPAGRVRDAFTPLLPALVELSGGAVGEVVRRGDDEDAIARTLLAGTAPILLSTGGTGRSRVDAVRRALDAVGARVLVDGVGMRPGHPTMAALLPGGTLVIALPGNPLAALLAALSFLPPALDAASGAAARLLGRGVLAEPLGRAGATVLVPVSSGEDGWRASAGIRSHMLTGLAASEAVAVVPAPGAAAGDSVRLLPLPW